MGGARIVAIIGAILLGGVLAAPAEALTYPPAEYFQFGSVYVAPNGTVNGSSSYECYLAGYVQIASSTFLGTGGPWAEISFSIPPEYFYEDLSSRKSLPLLDAVFGTVATLGYDSPSSGTITFGYANQYVHDGAKKIATSFPFTVKSSASEGNLSFHFTIQFPNCALDIQGIYR